jgi:hypothetical protein
LLYNSRICCISNILQISRLFVNLYTHTCTVFLKRCSNFVSKFIGLGRIFCPRWQCHEAAVIKMAYTTEQCVFLVKRFYQTASVIMVQREFRVKFLCRKAPSRSAINRLVNKFEVTGNMIDNKKGVVGKKWCQNTRKCSPC